MSSLDKISEIIPKLNEKNRYYILGGLLLVIFLVDYFLVMAPQLGTLRVLNPKITLLATDIKTAEENNRMYHQYQLDQERLRDKIGIISQRIISKEEVPVIMERISRMANKAGVKIDQIMPLKGSEEMVMKNNEGKYYSLPILVDARTGFHDFGRFINELEKNDVFLSITNFTFAADANDTVRHVAKLTVKVIIFEKAEEGSK